jgi:hypothetical protein
VDGYLARCGVLVTWQDKFGPGVAEIFCFSRRRFETFPADRDETVSGVGDDRLDSGNDGLGHRDVLSTLIGPLKFQPQ